MTIPAADLAVIRDLAKRKAEYAALPIMAERAVRWSAHNDGCGDNAPMIAVEISSFAHELLPPPSCTSPAGTAIERALRMSVLRHEHIGDDWVVAADFEVPPATHFVYLGISPEKVYPDKVGGKPLGYADIHKITDLSEFWPNIGPSAWSYDREATRLRLDIARDAVGDILDVRLAHIQPKFVLTRAVVELMGMENMYLNMIDYPDLMYKLLERMTDDFLAYFAELEKDGLLLLNNSVTETWPTTHGYTSRLSAPGGAVTMRDLWIGMDSQETAHIAPELFGEMVFPHYAKAAKRFGRLCYGCCEPVDRVWDWVKNLHGLSKVSVSPWCDVHFMGEQLRGKDIIFHRKISPNYVGLGASFDEAGFRAHISETLKTARGCRLELAARDINTLCGDVGRARRSVEIMRDCIEREW